MSDDRKLEAGLSWSASRANPRCWRAQYLSRIAAWGGWEKSASPLSQEAYQLKKLQNRWGWSGALAHRYIAKLLTSLFEGREVEPLGRILQYAKERFRTAAILSESAVRAEAPIASQQVVFVEDYYPFFSSSAARRHAFKMEWRKFRYSLTTFYNEALPHFAETPPEAVLELDKAGTDHTFTHFWYSVPELNHRVKIFVELDLGIRRGNRFVITDWKTGRRDTVTTTEHLLEMLVHANYVKAAHGFPLDQVQADLVYLSDSDAIRFEERTHSALTGEFDLKLVKDEMDTRIKEWVGRFTNPEKSETTISRWPVTSDKSNCTLCNFRRICDGAPPELRRTTMAPEPLDLPTLFEAEAEREAVFKRSRTKVAPQTTPPEELKLPF